jgi:hypothetical protein
MILIGVGLLVIVVLAISFFVIFFSSNFSEEDILNDPAFAITFCQESPAEKQTDCYLQIAEVLALNNSDIALQACLAINKDIDDGDWKNCIENLANKQTEQIKAVEICNSFNDDAKTKEHCYGGIKINFGSFSADAQLMMCDSKTGTDQSDCYSGLADDYWLSNASKALEICNKINDETYKERCVNSFSSSPEIVKLNPEIAMIVCDSLVLKSRCYINVANALASSDPKQATEICKKINDDIQISDCYSNVWFYSNDLTINNYDFTVSMCNVLALKKDDCLRRIEGAFIDVNRTKAAEVCKLMSSSASSSCLQEVGRE